MTDQCPDAIPLLGPSLDGELPTEDAAWLDEHVQGCAACQDRKALMVAQAAALRESLAARAEQADFSRLADRVMARISEHPAPLSERLAVWFRETYRSHRFAFGAGGLTVAAAALALAVFVKSPVTPQGSSEALAAADIALREADIERLELDGQHGTVLQFPGQTVIWVDDDAQPRSAQ